MRRSVSATEEPVRKCNELCLSLQICSYFPNKMFLLLGNMFPLLGKIAFKAKLCASTRTNLLPLKEKNSFYR